MNKEQALKLLLDGIEADERFPLMEYEALFSEENGEIRLVSDFTLYQKGKALFTLAPIEICRRKDEPILDTLIDRFTNILSVEMIELNNVRAKVKDTESRLQIKEERLKRQGKKPYLTDSQKKPLVKEIEKLTATRTELVEKLEHLYSVHPQLQLLRSLEQLRTDNE